MKYISKILKLNIIFTFFVIFIFISNRSPLYGDELDNLQQQIDQLNGQIQNLQGNISDLQSQAKDLMGQKNALLPNYYKINSLFNEASAKQTQINNLLSDLNKLNKEAEDSLNKNIAIKDKELKDLYELSQQNPYLTFLADRDAKSYLYSIELHESNLDNIKKQILAINNQIVSLKESIDKQKQEKALQDKQVAELTSQRNSLLSQIASLQNQYNNDQNKISQLQDQYGKLNDQEKAILAAKNAASGNNKQNGGGSGCSNSCNYNPSGDPGTFQIKINGNVVGSSANGPISFVPSSNNDHASVSGGNGGGSFRGTLEFRVNTNVNFINQLSIESYIKGLGEMPSSWPMEALKAQAVAGRTYALREKGSNASQGYDIDDTTRYQDYEGYGKEVDQGGAMGQAVDGSSGLVMKYDGSPIIALYSANNGGYERSNKEVWGSAAGSYAYLKSQSDGGNGTFYNNIGSCDGIYYSKKPPINGISKGELATFASEDAPISMSGARSLTDIAGIAIHLMNDPNHDPSSININNDYSAEATNILGSISYATFIYDNNNSFDSTLDTNSLVQSQLSKDNRNPHYTNTLRLHGTNGSSVDIGVNSNGSNYFRVAYNLASPGNDYLANNLWFFSTNSDGLNFYYSGFGHAIGMSQCGARGRASAGQNFNDILNFYYNPNDGRFSTSQDNDIKNTNADSCLSISSYPNNNACIRVGITGYGSKSNTITPSNSYTIFSAGNKIYSGTGNDKIEIIQN